MTPPAITLPDDLRKKYLAQLESRRSLLAEFLARCENSNATAEDFESARGCAHNLSGSGKTYGYPRISEAGRALEDAIESKTDPAELAVLAKSAIGAATEALGMNPIAQLTPRPSKAVAAAPAQKVGTRPLMLIAEDDPAVSDVLQGLFARDAEIILATNGRQALEIITARNPALAILDDNMPEMSGADVLEKVRQDEGGPMTQIVMLTANNRMTDIVRGIKAGAVDYITKPFDPGRLAIHIHRLLRHLDIKILLADDDEAVRSLLQHKFRKLGFRVFLAEDGEQALVTFRAEKPDLVILDRMMPGMDGLAVLRTIRNDPHLNATPVILLTAKRQNKDVVEGFDVGATDYVVKPFMPDEVMARVTRRLGLNEAGQM